MKLKLLAYTAVGAFAMSIATAGEYGKEVTEEVIAVDDSIGATLSAGYMSTYVFYGVDFGENGVWTGLDYTIDILPVAIDVGVWYINPTDSIPNDELDLYASTALPSFAGFDASLGFYAFFFPESSAETTYELALGLERSLGFVDWYGGAHYDFVVEGWYFDTGLSKGFGITDTIELVVSASIGYQNDYFDGGGSFNDVQVGASLPIALTDTATLEPYIGGVWALEGSEDLQDDYVHGGVSISVSF